MFRARKFLDSEREGRSWGFRRASRSIILWWCSAVKAVLRGQGFGSIVEREEFPEDFDKYLRSKLNWSQLEDAVDETHVAGKKWIFYIQTLGIGKQEEDDYFTAEQNSI
ncbi:hypothetical protein RHMOL_Rhmol10G0108800 [Rhododendron molle]|uniref:Uncharacterized protein n=2 Tax=Rhododendron molle TaxID=49168 RepID=A0ACC0M1C4_RHOML|nr:hypothetical protein RHMOL_Rhmol10G0108800 [Rhododendron molle]KAI8534675.1 hypothetical protein RHMOL_Rhmol10G0108800 [Rhododendron molle]